MNTVNHSTGGKKPDITSPAQIREQKRLLATGALRARAKWWQVIAAMGVGLLFVTLAAWYIVRTQWAAPALDANRYQAIFLDDGKAFFGKMKNTDGEYITIEDAYYTKSVASTADQAAQAAQTTDQTALIRVGSETYGPENSIQIARSKVLFWQNLRDDSKISQAIKTKSSN
jgi:hypothetical protein